ncbi:MAG: hypothetical protein QXK48_02005 [Candidatus Aenigmatarchaeota archaeon]
MNIEIDVEDLGINPDELEFLISVYSRLLFTVNEGKLICINKLDKEFEALKFYHISTLNIGDFQIDVFKDDENHGLLVKYKPVQMVFDSEKSYLFTVYQIETIEVYYEHSGEVENIDLKEILAKNPIINFELVKRGLINSWEEKKLEEETKNVSVRYRI